MTEHEKEELVLNISKASNIVITEHGQLKEGTSAPDNNKNANETEKNED